MVLPTASSNHKDHPSWPDFVEWWQKRTSSISITNPPEDDKDEWWYEWQAFIAGARSMDRRVPTT